MDYTEEECHRVLNPNGTKSIRCPVCKNHGEDIDSRGDCKNLITMKDGRIAQCMCYSKEHK